MEANETQEEALKREILEELSMEVDVQKKYLTVEHAYPDFSIIMHSYLCSVTVRKLIMHEHVNAVWLNVVQLKQLDWAAADIPIVSNLMEKKT